MAFVTSSVGRQSAHGYGAVGLRVGMGEVGFGLGGKVGFLVRSVGVVVGLNPGGSYGTSVGASPTPSFRAMVGAVREKDNRGCLLESISSNTASRFLPMQVPKKPPRRR
jgi:hypothetical protein